MSYMRIHERIKEVREKMNLNPSEFARLIGISQTSQYNYENGNTIPSAEYLIKLEEKGIDSWYILTGKRNATTLSQEESELLALWHKAPLVLRHAALNVLLTGKPNSSGHRVDISGTAIGTSIQQGCLITSTDLNVSDEVV